MGEGEKHQEVVVKWVKSYRDRDGFLRVDVLVILIICPGFYAELACWMRHANRNFLFVIYSQLVF